MLPFLCSIVLYVLYSWHWAGLVESVVAGVEFGRPFGPGQNLDAALSWSTWAMASFLSLSSILALWFVSLCILYRAVPSPTHKLLVVVVGMALTAAWVRGFEAPVGNSLQLITDAFYKPNMELFVAVLSGIQKATLILAPMAFSACMFTARQRPRSKAKHPPDFPIAHSQRCVHLLLGLSAAALVLGVAETRIYYSLAAVAGGHGGDEQFTRFAAQYAALTGALYGFFLTVNYVACSKLIQQAVRDARPTGPKSDEWLKEHCLPATTTWRTVQPFLLSASPFIAGLLQAATTF